MKKRLLILILACAMCATVTACMNLGGTSSDSSVGGTSSESTTQDSSVNGGGNSSVNGGGNSSSQEESSFERPNYDLSANENENSEQWWSSEYSEEPENSSVQDSEVNGETKEY